MVIGPPKAEAPGGRSKGCVHTLCLPVPNVQPLLPCGSTSHPHSHERTLEASAQWALCKGLWTTTAYACVLYTQCGTAPKEGLHRGPAKRAPSEQPSAKVLVVGGAGGGGSLPPSIMEFVSTAPDLKSLHHMAHSQGLLRSWRLRIPVLHFGRQRLQITFEHLIEFQIRDYAGGGTGAAETGKTGRRACRDKVPQECTHSQTTAGKMHRRTRFKALHMPSYRRSYWCTCRP